METDGSKPPDEPCSEGTSFFRRYKPGEVSKRESAGNYLVRYAPKQATDLQENSDQSKGGLDADVGAAELRHQPKLTESTYIRFLPHLVYVVAMLIAASVILIVLYQELWQGRSSAVAIYKPADTAVNESSGRSSDTSGLATMESPDVSTRRGKLSAQPKVFTSGTSTPSLASLLASARDFKERGMLQQAEQTYRNILREFPSDLSSEAEIDRMEQDRSMQQQAERARTSREAGLTKFRRGDYAGAQVDLVEAVNAGRTDTAVLYSLGMSYLKLKSYPQALATLNRCLNSTPDYPPALVGLALVQESMGNKEHALSLLNRALVLGGGAEFSTSKIKDMIANLNLEPSAPPKQPRTFSAFAVHRHSFLSGGCRGKLTVSGSVVEFQSDHPSHSFRLPSANLFPVKSSENEFRLYVNGTQYKFILEGKSVSALLTALGPE